MTTTNTNFEKDIATFANTLLAYATSTMKTNMPDAMNAEDLREQAVRKLVSTAKQGLSENVLEGTYDLNISKVNKSVVERTILSLRADGLEVTLQKDGLGYDVLHLSI